MSANIKASVDGTQAIIGVGGVDQMTVSNAGVVTANSFVGALNGSSVTATGSTTARTLANRFADVVNVKDFGAVGDGVADDTSAMQNAVNTGKSVFWPQGTYRFIELQINSSNREYIFDNGAILKKITDASNGIKVIGNGNVFVNPEIDGSRTYPITNPTNTSATNILCSGSYNKFYNLTSYAGGQGINMGNLVANAAKGNELLGGRIFNHWGVGIAQYQHEEGIVKDCIVYDCGLEAITCDVQSHRTIISHNQIYNVCVRGGVGATGCDGSDFVQVVNNIIVGSLLSGIVFAAQSGNNNFCMASNNIVVNSAGDGIRLENWLGPDLGWGFPWYTYNTIVEGNVIVGSGGFDINIYPGCNSNYIGTNKINPLSYQDNGLDNINSSSCQLRITNSSTDPLLKLESFGTQSTAIQWARSASLQNAVYTTNGGNFYLRNVTAGGTYIQTNGLDRLAVLNNGNTGVGTNIPQSILDVVSTTSGLIFPRMTTTERNAIVTNVDGMVIYNTTTAKLQVRAAGVWVDLH